jgi:hypothetical protein
MNMPQHIVFDSEADCVAAAEEIRNYFFDADEKAGVSSVQNWKDVYAIAKNAPLQKAVRVDGETIVPAFEAGRLSRLTGYIAAYIDSDGQEANGFKAKAVNEFEAILNDLFSEDGFRWYASNAYINKVASLCGKRDNSKSRARGDRLTTGNTQIKSASRNQIVRAICFELYNRTQVKLRLESHLTTK